MVSQQQIKILTAIAEPATVEEVCMATGLARDNCRAQLSRMKKSAWANKNTRKEWFLEPIGKLIVTKAKSKVIMNDDTIQIMEAVVNYAKVYPRAFYPNDDCISLDFTMLDKSSLEDRDISFYLEEQPDDLFKTIWAYLQENAIIGEGETPGIRVFNVPDSVLDNIFSIRQDKIGRLIYIEGEIISHTHVRPFIHTAFFTCKRCGAEIYEHSDDGSIKFPLECLKSQGGCGRTAYGTKFVLDQGRVIASSRQSIIIEEKILDQANRPKMMVDLPEYIVDPDDPSERIYKDGNTVRITGVVRMKKKKLKGEEIVPVLYVEAVNAEVISQALVEVEPSPDQIEKIRELAKDPDIFSKLAESVSPVLEGYESLKELLVLTMFYRKVMVLDDGTRVRKNVNILILGEASTGKSEILNWLAGFYPKSSVSSGPGASPAGLFGMPTRDELQGAKFTYISGMVPRSDGGLACVDELPGHISKYGEGQFLEALEARRITIFKGDIRDLKLDCDCPIIMASNWVYPKYDPTRAAIEQIPPDITQMFMSRCILINCDLLSAKIDEGKKLDRILSKHAGELDTDVKTPIDTEMFRAYIAYARNNFNPMVSMGEIRRLMKEYYWAIGTHLQSGLADGIQYDGTGEIPLTPRYFEDLIRLTEASARVHLRNKIDISDLERALKCLTLFITTFARDRDGKFDMQILDVGQPRSLDQIRKGLREWIRFNCDNEGIFFSEIRFAFSSEEDSLIQRALDSMVNAGEMKTFKKEGEDVYRPSDS